MSVDVAPGARVTWWAIGPTRFPVEGEMRASDIGTTWLASEVRSDYLVRRAALLAEADRRWIVEVASPRPFSAWTVLPGGEWIPPMSAAGEEELARALDAVGSTPWVTRAVGRGAPDGAVELQAGGDETSNVLRASWGDGALCEQRPEEAVRDADEGPCTARSAR